MKRSSMNGWWKNTSVKTAKPTMESSTSPIITRPPAVHEASCSRRSSLSRAIGSTSRMRPTSRKVDRRMLSISALERWIAVEDLAGDGAEGGRLRTARISGHHRPAGIGGFADRHVEWDLAEERHAHRAGRVGGAAMAEDVVAFAGIGRHEVAHVLDQAEQRDVEPLDHVDGLLRVDHREVLRRRRDHRAGELGLLEQRDLVVV